MRRSYPYLEGAERARQHLAAYASWQRGYCANLPPLPTRFSMSGGRDRPRPDKTPAQEAARLRVSAKVIARANRKRLRPYVARGVGRAVPAHGSGP